MLVAPGGAKRNPGLSDQQESKPRRRDKEWYEPPTNKVSNSNKISIEGGTWYYFTTDLNFKGFLPFRFLRFLDINGDRNGAVVEFIADTFFATTKVILLPYTKEPDYFRVQEHGLLPVWTFDGSNSENLSTVDLRTDWPRNILDKAAITPSLENAKKWTAK